MHAPVLMPSSKEYRINKVLESALRDISEQNRYAPIDEIDGKRAAINNILDAAHTGTSIKDMKGPDYEVEHHTVVDH